MSLYDVPTHDGYKVLTHTSTRRFARNGFSQVGNEIVPSHPIAPQAVKTSSIYNKNISGISEAGYGRAYPNYGLSKYPGAGSPSGSVLRDYRGAGSPRASVLRSYYGAGSPRGSVLAAYHGAGSPHDSVLSDAYINDNPPPGTLHPLSGVSRSGIPGRASSRGAGLSGFFDTLTSAASTLFSTGVKTAAEIGTQKLVQVTAPKPQPVLVTTTAAPVQSSAGWLGLSTGTLVLSGLAAAYFFTRNK